MGAVPLLRALQTGGLYACPSYEVDDRSKKEQLLTEYYRAEFDSLWNLKGSKDWAWDE